MLGRRTWRSGLTAMLLVLITACGPSDPSSPGDGATGPDATDPPPTSASQTDEVGPQPPATEEAPSPREETDGPEQPAAGGETGVSIAVPGLPVGAGGTVDLGGSWCGVFFWGESLPAGVELQITAAVVETEGATILDQPCQESPPCAGTIISLETPEQGCGVTVVPPSPDTDLVLLRLDGVLHCQDTSTCETLALASGSTAALENPRGTQATDGDGTETDGIDDDTPTDEVPVPPGSDTDGTTVDPGGG